jgi:hypothetical protein
MSLQTIFLIPFIAILALAVPAGIVIYLRYRGLPRYNVPVFPANAEEAARVYRHWHKHNRHATLFADARLEDGTILRAVGFDPDALVAVQVNDGEVPVWYYRHSITDVLVLNEKTSESERADFANM